MDYAFGGPLGASMNGFAAFVSGASSYLMPISLTGVVVEPAFINRLDSIGKLDIFLNMYGSMSLNIKQFQMLNENLQEALKILMDKGLVRILDLSQEGNELFQTLRTRLSDQEALSLAQAIDSDMSMVVLESQEARNMAVELGVTTLTFEEFLLEAYKQRLINPGEILKILS